MLIFNILDLFHNFMKLIPKYQTGKDILPIIGDLVLN